ncbi:MAG: hypothetical protein ABW208_09930 [Pyrinomonadaceae bacterium]
MVVPQTPPEHFNQPSTKPGRVNAPAASDIEHAASARQSVPTAEARGASVDGEDREQTPLDVRSATVEPRAGAVVSTVPTTIVDVEVLPQPVNTKQRPAETSTRPDVESRSAGALQPRTEVEHEGPPGATPSVGLKGIQVTARESGAQSTPPPIIEVTIGRIEVRAVTPPAAPPPQRERQAPPKMSLDDYLRAHGGGRS